MRTNKKHLVGYLGLMIFFFSSCGVKSDCCQQPDKNQIIISGVTLQENDIVKVVFTPIDGIETEPKYSFYKFGNGISTEGIAIKLYPYGDKQEIIGKERKFKFQLYIANTLKLRKTVIIKTEKVPNKKPWKLKIEKLSIENEDYVTKVEDGIAYIDLSKK